MKIANPNCKKCYGKGFYPIQTGEDVVDDETCDCFIDIKADFVLTHAWFDKIKRGQKTTEFRKKTPYWEHRLKGVKKGDFIVFRRGYSNTTIIARVIKITPYGYSALPKDVQDFMVGVECGDLFYGIDFQLFEMTKK